MTSNTIAHIADALVAARRGGPLVASSIGAPADDAEAYAIQDAVTARLGTAVPAWKVGAANPTATPNCAPVRAVHTATSVTGGKAETGVELEIAFRLGRTFAAGSPRPTRADVAAAIASAHIALEVCASRLVDGMQAPASLRHADDGTNLGLVLGPAIPNWQAVDVAGLRAIVRADGQVVADVTGGHTAPDILGLTTWLIGHLVETRGGVQAGTAVTTGSTMGIRWVPSTAHVIGEFAGLGRIDVRLTG